MQARSPFFSRIVPFLLITLGLLAYDCRTSHAPKSSDLVSGELRARLEKKDVLPLETQDAGVRSLLTPRFYARRNFRPAWIDDNGLVPGRAESLQAALSASTLEGLDPCDYRIDEVRAALFKANAGRKAFRTLPPRFLAELDFVLTDAFFIYAAHLADGKVNSETELPQENGAGQGAGLIDLLEHALEANEVEPALLGLRPQHDYYFGLRNALRDYRDRLCGLDDAAEDSSDVRTAARPTPPDARGKLLRREVRTIALNMERWRWLPRSLGRRFILVDVAAFSLLVGEDGRVPMSMKVVVGSVPWQTPIFSARITGFILNPVWNCTSNIFYKELINYIRADKNYLPSNKMVILQGWGGEERELDPAAMDWPNVSPATYPNLHLRQLPGSLNILGRLKFVMPNMFDIFLHDTPYQEDFKQMARIFSHGCIRAERPFDLAAYLSGSALWTKDKILAAIEALDERTVYLSEPIPIHVNYCTAWPRPDGVIDFRADVYGRDEKLAAVFFKRD
jgi:murein L,D-transpeptidase YcbB/YkuD